ncbi:MAG: NADH dehydrogenase [Betaproteobacteria bacterium RIFCSPLOWO2_12_FULL_65_14]|nr:MAG: NADH dehydrogenase [Betaproteobacteria bacterium RIFCSPLOWO2_12_FULL_65_14]
MPRLRSPAALEELRADIVSRRAACKPCISVCCGAGCDAVDSARVVKALRDEAVKQGGKVGVKATGCHGFCEKGPNIIVTPGELCYFGVGPEDVPGILAGTAKGVRIDEVPFYKHQMRLLIGDNPRIDPTRIEDYLALGGYAALSKALFEMTPDQVLDEVKKANLRGRGGGGFPAGLKWETAKNAPGDEKYVIVNGHEGEPGAFMDRALFTGNPHKVLEGLIIGAYAIGSHRGFIYTRHDSPKLIEHIETALAQAEEYGLLGGDILGSGFDFRVEVHFDVGIFVSGESSALMRSIEGNPPEPRPKYIRTSVSGIWDKPSNLNNVETWANVPQIISRGAGWYNSIGTEGSKGTKLVSLSGHVVNSGVVEVPMGTPLRAIVHDIGGGVPGGKPPKAVHFGGPMGGSIPERLIDTPLDFDALAALGAPIGAGGLLVMGDDTDMVDVARYFLEFLTNESCGKCVPCREGLLQMLKILTNMTKGKGRNGDIGRLEDLSDVTGMACLCALGKTSCDPLRSMLRYFRDEYEARIPVE